MTHLALAALLFTADTPKDVTVRVSGPDGNPVAGADVGTFMVSRIDPKNGEARAWRYHEPMKTREDGTAKVPFAAPPVVVRDASARHIALPVATSAQLATGELHVKLIPEHTIKGQVVFDECKKAGVDPGKAYIHLFRGNQRIAQIDLNSGEYDIPVVPGTYTVRAFGDELQDDTVTITVTAAKAEVAVRTLAPKPSVFSLLRGKAAPEFEGLAGWHGKPVRLADLKGQYVLVDFWGHWCAACIEVMPVMIELHETFAGKGLAVVGVHVDGADGVNTPEKLNEKIVGFAKNAWKGKTIAFPNAVVTGQQAGRAPEQYGIDRYPTTVLIDPEGRVVDKFNHNDIKSATAAIEELLRK
jgi:thiol-disulfide isomerase/thioredoxin